MSDQFTRRLAAAILGESVTYTLYPVIGAGVPVGTVVTSGAGAWGADKELIPAAGIATDYFVCACDLDTAGAAQPFVVNLEVAGATTVFALRCDLTAVTANIARFLAGQFPVRVAAGSQLTARSSGTAAKVLGVSTVVATGI